jgi:hypothetical protein
VAVVVVPVVLVVVVVAVVVVVMITLAVGVMLVVVVVVGVVLVGGGVVLGGGGVVLAAVMAVAAVVDMVVVMVAVMVVVVVVVVVGVKSDRVWMSRTFRARGWLRAIAAQILLLQLCVKRRGNRLLRPALPAARRHIMQRRRAISKALISVATVLCEPLPRLQPRDYQRMTWARLARMTDAECRANFVFDKQQGPAARALRSTTSSACSRSELVYIKKHGRFHGIDFEVECLCILLRRLRSSCSLEAPIQFFGLSRGSISAVFQYSLEFLDGKCSCLLSLTDLRVFPHRAESHRVAIRNKQQGQPLSEHHRVPC